MNMDSMYDDIKYLAHEAGDIIKKADPRTEDIEAKGGHANFVTKYDKMVQEKLRNGLKRIFPEAAFYGEEGVHEGFPDADYVFVVDPIDGTTNFIKGLGLSAVAIGLTRKKERIFGLVYNPFSDEMYTAVKGDGAKLNGCDIHVSGFPLEQGLTIFGTSVYYEGYPEIAFSRAREFMNRSLDVRRLGSAEIDLCYVACGRAELYFEPMIQPWDFAAGSLIVEEAGGHVSQWDGSPLDVTKPGSCMAHGSGFNIGSLDGFLGKMA